MSPSATFEAVRTLQAVATQHADAVEAVPHGFGKWFDEVGMSRYPLKHAHVIAQRIGGPETTNTALWVPSQGGPVIAGAPGIIVLKQPLADQMEDIVNDPGALYLQLADFPYEGIPTVRNRLVTTADRPVNHVSDLLAAISEVQGRLLSGERVAPWSLTLDARPTRETTL